MTNYDVKISINFKFSSQQLSDKYLKSIYLSLNADKNIDTNITEICKKNEFKNLVSYNKKPKFELNIKNTCLKINIHTEDISELRASVNSCLRLFNMVYSCMNTLQQNIDS